MFLIEYSVGFFFAAVVVCSCAVYFKKSCFFDLKLLLLGADYGINNSFIWLSWNLERDEEIFSINFLFFSILEYNIIFIEWWNFTKTVLKKQMEFRICDLINEEINNVWEKIINHSILLLSLTQKTKMFETNNMNSSFYDQ